MTRLPPRQRSLTETVLNVAAALGLVGIALEFGFDEPPLAPVAIHALQIAIVLLYLAFKTRRIVTASNPWQMIREHAVEIALLGGGLTVAVVLRIELLHLLLAAVLYVALMRTSAIVSLLLGRLYGRSTDPAAKLHPARLMLTSFATLILLGGLLLSLPRAMSVETRAETGHYAAKRVLNCFFTATSATCVTGLVVYDTGSDFTRFGQLVILVLIQAGGLGIMVFGSIFGLMLGRQLSLRQSLVLQDIYSHQTIGQIGRMARFICISTLAIEALAAVILYRHWPVQDADVASRWFDSVFHAVSAFCNAGFVLQSDSLISFQRAWPVYAVIMPAIILGGLGFPVLAELGRRAREIVSNIVSRVVRSSANNEHPARRVTPISLHGKIVLLTTLILIVLPAAGLFLFESSGAAPALPASESAMRSLGTGDRLLAALFQSVTCRTAGFNTVSLAVDDVSSSSLFLMCILMFIGGSPASTAGGVKTVAVAMLILGTLSTLRRRRNVEAFHRQIPIGTIRQAAVVITVMSALVGAVVLSLSYTESATLAEVLFESVSACATVGLSTGLTPHLTIAGKLVIMLAMFAGRLGPLTLLVALAGRERTTAYDYPREQITIG